MNWPRERLIQGYLQGPLSAEAQKEFDRLSRQDPSFSHEVVAALQRALGSLPEESERLSLPSPPVVPPASRPPFAERIKPFLSTARPWVGLALMGLAALTALGLLWDLGRQTFLERRHPPVKAVLRDEDGDIGVPPGGGGGAKEWTFPVGNKIYLSITSDAGKSVELFVERPDRTVLRLLYRGSWNKGLHQVVWDGKDAAGKPVPPGEYLVVLKENGRALTDRLRLQSDP